MKLEMKYSTSAFYQLAKVSRRHLDFDFYRKDASSIKLGNFCHSPIGILVMSSNSYGSYTSSWLYTPLPPPVAPTPPDFHKCHPFYGVNNLCPDVCGQAAGRLPIGNTPVRYGVRRLAVNNGPYYLPIQITDEDLYCDCAIVVDVDLMDPYNVNTGRLNLDIAPDALRTMASWIIDRCVSRSRLGGFGVLSIQSLIDWAANDTTTDDDLLFYMGVPWEAGSPAVTVTVTSKLKMGDANPGPFDPAIAEALADGVRRKGNTARADKLSKEADIMGYVEPRKRWWNAFSSQPQYRGYADMTYTCDANLGAPSAADCSLLAYSGLGSPSDTVTIGPGSGTKFLSLNSCNVGITASTSIVLTWAQIQAGLSALVDNCVTHPLLAARGGRAFAGNIPSSGIRSSKRAVFPPNGLDALPPGVNITLFEQDFSTSKDPGAELRSCSWTQALSSSGNVKICAPGT